MVTSIATPGMPYPLVSLGI